MLRIKRIVLLPIMMIFLFCTACSDRQTVTAYSLQKVDPKTSYGHNWLPLNPTIYSIKQKSVISKTVGLLTEYNDCTVLSVKDWECRYSDGSGSFGFRNGDYWEYPMNKDFEYVSQLEYNLVRCKWCMDGGFIEGVIGCIANWQ